MRARLLQLHAAEHVLLLTLHHIVSDGWSMEILLKELSAFYEAFSTGNLAGLPELSIQYADYALWQREWLQGEVLEGQLGYWKKQLEGSLRSLRAAHGPAAAGGADAPGARAEFDLPGA